MTRRILTVVTALVPIVVLVVLGAVVQVPYVALGPGPTFNTLGVVAGKPVIQVQGHPVDPTTGHLNMTTVSVRDGLSLFDALSLWASGDDGLVPREELFPPDKSRQAVKQENHAAFQNSEQHARSAALRYLHYPFTVGVAEVAADAPAGGSLEPGDQLVKVNNVAVTTPDQVQSVMKSTHPGERIPVVYRRSGKEHTASITLAPSPHKNQSKGIMGVVLGDVPNVPFNVDFHLSNIGGPSAGLMFTLGLIDKLTPGELDAGKFVAGTGTIDPEGNVGPIGGIPHKMRAARDAGATVFLVPEKNCQEASAHDPSGLQLIKVSNLGSAVDSLHKLADGKPVPHC